MLLDKYSYLHQVALNATTEREKLIAISNLQGDGSDMISDKGDKLSADLPDIEYTDCTAYAYHPPLSIVISLESHFVSQSSSITCHARPDRTSLGP